jgi:hypothetical protein
MFASHENIDARHHTQGSSYTKPSPRTVLRSSQGDRAVLGRMGQEKCAIFNSEGTRGMFTLVGDSLEGYMA